MVDGQAKVTRDLYAARDALDVVVSDVAADVTPHDVDGDRPCLTFVKDGAAERLDCDFVIGCDGFHGVSRQAIPAGKLRTLERVYPFGWLGVRSATPPVNEEIGIASCRERGGQDG